jgi:hypothetical protein
MVCIAAYTAGLSCSAPALVSIPNWVIAPGGYIYIEHLYVVNKMVEKEFQ